MNIYINDELVGTHEGEVNSDGKLHLFMNYLENGYIDKGPK